MVNRITWDKRIRRAEELLERDSSSSQVLTFYRHILALQGEMAQSLESQPASAGASDGTLRERLDIDLAMRWLPALLQVVEKHGPAKLAEEAGRIRVAGDGMQRQMLVAFFDDDQGASRETPPLPHRPTHLPDQTDSPSSSAVRSPAPYQPSHLFARVLFQPQADALASRMPLPANYSEAICPLCGSAPQFAVLRPEGDGGKRHLACSLCLTEWEFRRIVCPNCDEKDPFKLPRYSTEDPLAVRVEACETCKAYLKSFDMTVDGRMVPEAEEMASVALDLWAAEHGYHKFQLNLLGF